MTAVYNQSEVVANFRNCHIRGCLGMGCWQPTISLSPDGVQRAYIPFPHWLFCDSHKGSIGLEDLVDRPLFDGTMAWDRIVRAFTRVGKLPPTREYASLLWRMA